MTSKVTRQMRELVSRSSLGSRDVVKIRRTTPRATAKKVVKDSRTTSDSPKRRT